MTTTNLNSSKETAHFLATYAATMLAAGGSSARNGRTKHWQGQ